MNEDFKQLRHLILIEKFKDCIHPEVKTHLNERCMNNLPNAANDFALTHKLSIIQVDQISFKSIIRVNQMVRKELKMEVHSQDLQVREMKILQEPNQSQGMMVRPH